MTGTDPSDSHLMLTDGRLTFHELIGIEADAHLAYLSACDTAFGGGAVPDEAIHVASAFQLAGFRHVVGTLWRVADDRAHDLAGRFYRHPA